MNNNIELEELKTKFNNIYYSNDDLLQEHVKYLLLFFKNNSITRLIIDSIEKDEYFTIWKPIESKYTIGYEDYNLPDNEKSMAALSLYFLKELDDEPNLLFSRHHTNLKTGELIKTIKDLFVKKLEDYIYLNIKYNNNILYLLNRYKYQCE